MTSWLSFGQMCIESRKNSSVSILAGDESTRAVVGTHTPHSMLALCVEQRHCWEISTLNELWSQRWEKLSIINMCVRTLTNVKLICGSSETPLATNSAATNFVTLKFNLNAINIWSVSKNSFKPTCNNFLNDCDEVNWECHARSFSLHAAWRRSGVFWLGHGICMEAKVLEAFPRMQGHRTFQSTVESHTRITAKPLCMWWSALNPWGPVTSDQCSHWLLQPTNIITTTNTRLNGDVKHCKNHASFDIHSVVVESSGWFDCWMHRSGVPCAWIACCVKIEKKRMDWRFLQRQKRCHCIWSQGVASQLFACIIHFCANSVSKMTKAQVLTTRKWDVGFHCVSCLIDRFYRAAPNFEKCS